jgi:FkbM family methyltransferase
MRKMLIDCGSHSGQVLEDFIVQRPDYEYYAFEPNPNLLLFLEAIKERHAQRICIYDQAVWIVDGSIDFFLGHSETSTLLRGKVVHHSYGQQIDYDHPIVVESVDFSNWILSNFSPYDYMVIKMDIEGAEYAVLEKMIRDGTILYVNELYVEWHWDRISELTEERHRSLLQKLEKITSLCLHTWT